MPLVSLHPAITDLLSHFGKSGQLLYPSASFAVVEDPGTMVDLLIGQGLTSVLSSRSFSAISSESDRRMAEIFESRVAGSVQAGFSFKEFSPQTLEQVFDVWHELSSSLDAASQGRGFAGRVKAQVLDWERNFYDRLRGKRVIFLSQLIEPHLAGLWIPDCVKMLGTVTIETKLGQEQQAISLDDLEKFRPDVVIVAPLGKDLSAARKVFLDYQQLPSGQREQFEKLPAFKRGEVYFCDGQKHFYRFDGNLMDSFALLVSMIAGLESGYITPRDSFAKLRWLELQRHRL